MVAPGLARGFAAEAVPDPVSETVLFPAMIEWSRAGCRGGFPDGSGHRPAVRLSASDDLQAAVDRMAGIGGGSVVLAPGDFPLRETLMLRSNVTVRGSGVQATRLLLLQRGAFPGSRLDAHGFSTWTTGILAHRVQLAFLENLSIAFDPALPAPPTLRTHKAAFVNDPEGRTDLYVVSVRFSGCEDCGLRDCRILNSGSHPLMIEASRHVSVLRTEIDGSHNKGDLGNGYVNVTRSSHVLLSHLQVRDVRHLTLQNSDERFLCRYNVLVDSHLEVDVNYHNGDAGHNLVQDCRIAVPPWHWWGPFAAGVAGQHRPPGPGNLIYRCDATRSYANPARNRREAPGAERVYRIRDHFGKEAPLVGDFARAPETGSLLHRS